MRMPQGIEWVIILVLILLLFGAKRLPDAARGLGRSLRILKAETKGLHDDDDTTAAPAVPPPATPAAALPDATSTSVPVDAANAKQPAPPPSATSTD